ncbi:MAG: flavodoxin family protein [Pseudomonadales bacterium]|nr:flavodoxin family protein [Pseudomonadales bacterium]
MKQLSIIYHSKSGNTRKMAHAVLAGAQLEKEVESHLITAFDANLATLANSDAVIFGTPENFGYMSGALKDFFDRTYDDALSKQIRPAYALFVSAGNDGTNAIRETRRILAGYNMQELAEPIISRKRVTEADEQACKVLGQTIAAGLALGIF